MKTLGLFDPDFPMVDLKTVPGFRYRGGKFNLRRYISRWMPISGHVYVEPFAGRGNMLFLAKKFADFKQWVLNDLRTIPFFQSIEAYDGHELSWPEEEDFHARLAAGDNSLLFMEPALFWDGAMATKQNGKRTVYAAKFKKYNTSIYKRVVLRAKRLLRDVAYSTRDAVKVIREYGRDKDNFLYIDPPYLHANVDTYTDGMIDRQAMIQAMLECKARWLFSEYPCDDLLETLGKPLTSIKKVKIITPGPNKTKIVRSNTECLWANYAAKPRPFSFGSYNPPMRQSIRILEKYARPVSFKRWRSLVPSCWPKKLVRVEFKRMCRDPYCYFDGQSIITLEGRP